MINLTMKEYMSCSNPLEYNFLINSKPKDFYGVYSSDINNMTYEQVKSVARTLRNIKTWNDISNVFETVFNINKQEFLLGKVTDFFSAKNYVIQKFKEIAEKESKLLSNITKDSVLWDHAGGKKLNKFSDILPLTELGKIYGIYPFELKDYKYKEILLLLTIETTQKHVDTEFNKLKYGRS